jgi:hypothetical protein
MSDIGADDVREVFLTIHPGCVRWIVCDGPKSRSGSDPIDAINAPFDELIAFGLKNSLGPHRGLTTLVLHIEDERVECRA